MVTIDCGANYMDKNQKTLFDTEPPPWETDSAEERLVATVVLSAPPFGEYDYAVPERLRTTVEPGRRVRVPIGRTNRSMIGYVLRVVEYRASTSSSGHHRLKEVISVVDDRALLSPALLHLTQWMAEYYLCPIGQALETVVPSGVRSQAGTREVMFLSVPASVSARLAELQLPKKQREVLQSLAASNEPLTWQQLAEQCKCGRGPIKVLEDKGLIHTQRSRVMQKHSPLASANRESHLQLNDQQKLALDAILEALYGRKHQTILVHGVTGSGKTELYMQAIDEVVSFGRQAIVLVPEISLTPQTLGRFRSRFEHVAVLHSHLTPVERNWHWRRIAEGDVQVVVGARSAIFAPVPRLGLVVLDEEHDASFKQDTAPRYHARDVALFRASQENVPVVLGSATPSLESWQHAQDGNYLLVSLPHRILDRPLPHVEVIDLRDEFRNRMTRGAIGRPLHMAIVESLKSGGQVILLLNRRGFSTAIQCPSCGEVVRCPNCDLALTHHKEGEKAICHYCDYEMPAPTKCPECRFDGIRYAGLGTQRLEAEIRARFPDASVLRMDSDTMQKAGSHEEAFSRFRSGEIQILLGTQMIAKGLDFPNVTLVGVINADTALHFPDFRAAERTFQLVTQVAGRTGRGEKGGRVLVQTFSPEHPAVVAASRHDFVMFAEQELPIRRDFGYPPFAALARLIIRGPHQTFTEQFCEELGKRLEARQTAENLDCRILGPASAPIAKLRSYFRFHILLQSPDIQILRRLIHEIDSGLTVPEGVQWIVDVDPVDML